MRINSKQSIAKAFRELKSGETLFLEEGTYRVQGQAVLTGRAGITIRGEGRVVVQGGLKFEGCHNLDIQDLTIRQSRTHGLFVVGSLGLRVARVRSVNNAGSGLLTGNVLNVLIERGLFFKNTQHGIYLSQSGDDLSIYECECLENRSAGIQINGDERREKPDDLAHDSISQRVQISGCVLSGNQKQGGAAAITLSCVRSAEIRRNYVVNHPGRHGIALWDGGRKTPEGTFACHDVSLLGNEIGFVPGKGQACISIGEGCSDIRIGEGNKSLGSVKLIEDQRKTQK